MVAEMDASLPDEYMCSVSIVTQSGQSGSSFTCEAESRGEDGASASSASTGGAARAARRFRTFLSGRIGSVWHVRSTSFAAQSIELHWLHVATSSPCSPPPHAQHMSFDEKSSSS